MTSPVRLSLLALAVLAGTSAAFGVEGFSADDAVTAALLRSPDVMAAKAAGDAARAQLRQDGVFLGNPEVSASTSLAGSPKQSAEVSQPLSLTGEGWAARAADRASVDAATAALTRSRLELVADTRGAWAGSVVASDGARLARESLDLAVSLRTAVEKKLAAGEATDLDLRLSRLSEATAASAWLAARREEDEAHLRLVALVGDVPFTLPADPLTAAPLPTRPAGTRTDLVAAQARVRAAEASLDRARAAAMPTVALGAFVERDGADLSVGPSIGLEIPLWNRNQAEIASGRGEAAVARAQADQIAAVASTEGDRAATLARDAEPWAALATTGLLDDARAALAEVDAGYRAGELDLPDAIQIRTEVLDGEAAVLELAGQVVQARLDFLLATEDPALLPEGAR
jgi:cobalt-zinc-cadmium efflux system outer membrane protein